MRESQYSDEQIVAIVHESHAHRVEATSKKHNVSRHTIYIWWRKYGSMDTSPVSELKRMMQEDARLKKLVAERDLEIEIMKEIASDKW